MKAIYAKLGVASPAELSAKLFYEGVSPILDGRRVREFAPADSAA